MALLDKETYLNLIKKYITGDDDEALKDVEDLTETFDTLSVKDTEDWKGKYEANDKAWREKYKARFFSIPSDKEDKDTYDNNDEDEKEVTFEDLFKEKREDK